jgi:hypothetical protein
VSATLYSSTYVRNPVKDQNGDRLADSHNVSNRWKNYFSRLSNAYSVIDARQAKLHSA